MAKKKSRIRSGARQWEEFEQRMAATAPSTKALSRGQPATNEKGIAAEFDPDEREVLRRLATRSRLLRKRSEPLGNVVFLHGITGSDLSVAQGNGPLKSTWVDVPRLIFGHLNDLRLASDGKREADATMRVEAVGVNRRFYARAVLALRAQWNVEPFAYDWRKDIDEASDALAALIRDRFNGEPVHLVAHSMGGLVARNMIRRHKDLWVSMRHPELTRGGRLVMLGTPNYGSYAIAQVLTGTDALLARLERFDLRHNLREILEITNSFLGTYLLLPAPAKLPMSLTRLYEAATWGSNPGVPQGHLDRALEFYNQLDTPDTVDPARMIYIAGTNQPTIKTLKVAAPGEFEYEFTNDGDGRVPHELGILSGVPTKYVDEVHGDLARNEAILLALDEILQRGKTDQLPNEPVVRAIPSLAESRPPTLRSYRAGADRAALDVLEAYAQRTRAAGSADVLDEKEKQLAGDSLIHAALGARTPLLPGQRKDLALAETPHRITLAKDRLQISVGVRFGRIQEFSAPVVVVGHYRGVKPANAIGAIDEKLDGWIARAVKRGMISGQVGETFYVPVKDQLPAGGVVIAGMGEYGQFSASALFRVMANVAQGAAALNLEEIGSVLVGAGEGSLNVEMALNNLLDGFCSGLLELRAEEPDGQMALRTLWIVEYDPERFVLIGKLLDRVVESAKNKGVTLTILQPTAQEQRAAKAEHKRRCARRLMHVEDTQPRFNEVRLTAEYDRDSARQKEVFRLAALTNSAVVSAREIQLTLDRAEKASMALAGSEGRAEQTQFGRMLFNYLIPEDFQGLFEANSEADIRLVVDPTTAALPWEMLCFPDPGNKQTYRRFGTDRRLTRQFRTLLSRTPGVSPPRTDQLRALVIADPAKEPAWQLPGARAEGRLVAALLRSAKLPRGGNKANGEQGARRTNPRTDTGRDGENWLDIVVEQRIGSEECDPMELLALLNSGDFDIVHFSGHGNYTSDDPAKSGWVLDADNYVTAPDIFRARKVPWLVVANACYSGVLRRSEPYPSLDVARRGASIAEAFMERGVPNYLGTGWTVDDSQAAQFANTFYGELLQNESLGTSVGRAREGLFDEPTGSTWGAYQFYGDPTERLLKGEPTIRRRTWATTPRKRKNKRNDS